MLNITDHITAAQLATLPEDGKRYELVEGVLHKMSPAGGRHGRIAGKLLLRIGNYVEQFDLGTTFAAETGFLIHRNPDTVRAADVAFIAHDRLVDLVDHPGYLPLAPELVAEVVSSNDLFSDVEAKAIAWLRAQVRVVLVVDPQTATVRVYQSAAQIQVYREGVVELEDVLPGFRLDVAELFA